MIQLCLRSQTIVQLRHLSVIAGALLLASLCTVLVGGASAAFAAPATQTGSGRTFTVNRADDSSDGSCTVSDCSLRDAILAANATPARDTIAFELDPAQTTIVLSSTLPVVTAPLLIDGSTQPDYRDAPLIEVSGRNLARPARNTPGEPGIVLAAAGSTVRALRLTDFPGDVLVVQAADATIQGCELGLAADGQRAAASLGSGIVVDNAANARIGGTTPAERNVIAAHREWGIRVQGQQSAGSRITGNYIGTDRTALGQRTPGEGTLGNTAGGILIEGSREILIGGTTAGAGNVIAGNGGAGILIRRSNASEVQVQGNSIGVGQDGIGALPNAAGGIVIEASSAVQIGGSEATARNVIAGNGGVGILIRGNASDVQVQGNYIGTDRTGTTALGNQGGGILLQGTRDVQIGGTTAANRNVIAGNNGAGIAISGSSATRNLVQGNYIGTDASGTLEVGNSDSGIVIEAPRNQIGGADAAARNVIAGNGSSGIRIVGSAATGNVVQGNYIGTDRDGLFALSNGQDGIALADAPRNQIGGTAAGAGNLIAGNRRHGITIQGDQAPGNLVQGNRIGTDAGGSVALSNGRSGIFLISSDGIRIGGREEGAANVIVGHRENGVFSSGSNAELDGNEVRDNATALRVQGGQMLALGNRFDGNPMVFVLNGGELRAALNQITGYEQAVERTTGIFVGNYNWWGRGTGPSPDGLDLDTWNSRLYAVPAAWNAAPQEVRLDDATLQGGSGTAVIVRYPREVFDVAGEEPFSQRLCSDYYTFFTIDGGGLWQASLPVDATPACAEVLQQAKVFRVRSTPQCRSILANADCWEPVPPENRPNIAVQPSDQSIRMSGLLPNDLEVVAYATGDIPQPLSREQRQLINLGLLGLVIVVVGLVWWWQRRAHTPQRGVPVAPPPPDNGSGGSNGGG